MKQQLIACAVVFAAIGGWASAQTVGRQQPSQAPSIVTQIDRVALLNTRLDQLQNRVQALETQVHTLQTENEAQGSAILSLAAWRNATNATISGMAAKEAAFETRFNGHTHNYVHPIPTLETRQFVTESHATGDDYANGTFISHWNNQSEATTPPN